MEAVAADPDEDADIMGADAPSDAAGKIRACRAVSAAASASSSASVARDRPALVAVRRAEDADAAEGRALITALVDGVAKSSARAAVAAAERLPSLLLADAEAEAEAEGAGDASCSFLRLLAGCGSLFSSVMDMDFSVEATVVGSGEADSALLVLAPASGAEAAPLRPRPRAAAIGVGCGAAGLVSSANSAFLSGPEGWLLGSNATNTDAGVFSLMLSVIALSSLNWLDGEA
jgi:hypothetical protein